MPSPLTEAEKEKVKLRATYLNGLALLFAGVGAIGPFLAFYQQFIGAAQMSWEGMEVQIIVLLTVFLVSGAMSLDLHWEAQKTLNKLSPPLEKFTERKIPDLDNEGKT